MFWKLYCINIYRKNDNSLPFTSNSWQNKELCHSIQHLRIYRSFCSVLEDQHLPTPLLRMRVGSKWSQTNPLCTTLVLGLQTPRVPCLWAAVSQQHIYQQLLNFSLNTWNFLEKACFKILSKVRKMCRDSAETRDFFSVFNTSPIFMVLLLHSLKYVSSPLKSVIIYPHVCGLTALWPSEAVLQRNVNKYFLLNSAFIIYVGQLWLKRLSWTETTLYSQGRRTFMCKQKSTLIVFAYFSI